MALSAATRRLKTAVWTVSLLAAGAAAAPAGADAMPGGRLVLAGEASATLAPEDRGYFNYSDYGRSGLRLFRLEAAGELRFFPALSLLADVRSDNLGTPRLYAAFLRAAPWPRRAVDLQLGVVPPIVGSFSRRRYAAENPLPSVPLAYQYLTSLRADAIPETVEQLVAQRGRGWLLTYPLGDATAAPGLPLVAGERWDTGVQLRLGREPWSLAAAVTQGSPSRPRFEDDNDGKQLAARLAWRASPGLALSVAAASADYLSRTVQDRLPRDSPDGRQEILSLDADVSGGRWILRAEAIFSRFELPAVADTRIEDPLSARAVWIEARCKLRPGVYAAARAERLGFGDVAGASLGHLSWDAGVTRLEVGGGWTPRRGALVKLAWQHNRREAGRVRRNHLVIAQVVLWR